MKHNLKITIILLSMFFLTQLIGLAVIYKYSQTTLPYGMQPPEEMTPKCPQLNSVQDFFSCVKNLVHFIIAFAVAILLIFLLMKYKIAF